MKNCPSCGKENPDGFQFCGFCTAPLAAATWAREQRKTVTVLFCDVAGYTARGERLDPEALRRLQLRYFAEARGALEQHGATVEKFIGDAVMAVFGIPQAHEDDALRAARAAIELRDSVTALGLEARIGINTGEVVTASGDALVTGDAVNVAARLEQAAQPGHILLGHATLALVREAVESEPVPPLKVKGKTEPVHAYRLLTAREAPERAHGTAFVGRTLELDLLRRAWRRACEESRCELVTVVGDAGIGKSRLTAEFLATAGARVVRGRCLSYGAGITYRPVVDVLQQLDALPSERASASALCALLGETDAETSAVEIAWAFRKLLEERAPLVCVFDDIQWAEETFLDLLEHIAHLSSGGSILLLCMARPDLLDRRAWEGTLRLEPLADVEVEELIPADVHTGLRARIAHASGGNPLFIAEMLAMTNGEREEIVVPPSLQAVLAARLDQLDASERRVLEGAAVEGEVFHRGAVSALVPLESQMTVRLATLVRRELVRPDAAQIPGEDGFRFRHLLIRDTAYETLPKSHRAELHELYADWLEEHGRDVVELDELVGHHLEQAFRYQTELGEPDASLADRAGDRLAAAGRRAFAREDAKAAGKLFDRALELLRPSRLDLRLELELARALRTSDPTRAALVAVHASEMARVDGDEAGAALAQVEAAATRALYGGDGSLSEVEELGRAALPLLEQAEDHRGLARVWADLAPAAEVLGSREKAALASEQAIHHARLTGQSQSLFGLERALAFGPRPADEALSDLDRVVPDQPSLSIVLHRAALLGMLVRFDEAWEIALPANDALRERVGHGFEYILAYIALYAGDQLAAAGYLRQQCADLEALGRWPNFAFHATQLGRCLCLLGQYDEAEALVLEAKAHGAEDDIEAQVMSRGALALVLADRGQDADAEVLAREAVSVAERMDGLNVQADAYWDLAEVRAAAGRTDEAAGALDQALDRYGRKKNLAMVAQVRPRLEELRARVT